MLSKSPELLEKLKQQFAFDAWFRRNRLERHLLIWRFRMLGTEFHGWTPSRVRLLQLPERLLHTRAIWSPTLPDSLALSHSSYDPSSQMMAIPGALEVDVFEYPSRERAHYGLLELLGQFQLPGLRLEEDEEVGDVFFTGGERVAVFARANIVLFGRSLAGSDVPVKELVAGLDREFAATREQIAPEIIAAKRLERPATVRTSLTTPVPLSLPAPLQQTARAFRTAMAAPLPSFSAEAWPWHMCKVFSHLGETVAEDDQLVYQPGAVGVDDVVFLATDPSGRATTHQWRIEVGQD